MTRAIFNIICNCPIISVLTEGCFLKSALPSIKVVQIYTEYLSGPICRRKIYLDSENLCVLTTANSSDEL